MALKQWLARMLYGRYGIDGYCNFLFGAALVCMAVSLFTGGIVKSVLVYGALGILIYAYVRVFSKNIALRQAQNARYQSCKRRVLGLFSARTSRDAQGRVYRIFACPRCGQKVRVPKGKGKVRITCPACANHFEKKS